MPAARSASSSAGCSVSGSGAVTAVRAPSNASRTSRSSARPASSRALQGWVSGATDKPLEIVRARCRCAASITRSFRPIVCGRERDGVDLGLRPRARGGRDDRRRASSRCVALRERGRRRPGRRRRRVVGRRHGRDRRRGRRRGPRPGVAAARVRAGRRQGRRDVARAERADRRPRLLRRRRHRGVPRALRLRPARAARLRAGRAVRQGLLPAPVSRRRRRRRADRRRPRHRADRAPAAAGLLSGARAACASRSRARWPARRELLERVAFCTGYAIETGLLLDVYAEVGIDGLAQVDLCVRQNRHQSIEDLAPMSAAVLAAVTSRLHREGRLLDAAGGRAARAPAARRAARAARPGLTPHVSGSKPASAGRFGTTEPRSSAQQPLPDRFERLGRAARARRGGACRRRTCRAGRRGGRPSSAARTRPGPAAGAARRRAGGR